MEEINYPRYNEVLYTTVLANGLRVNLLPRKNFHKTYGVLTTDYGSIDNTFIPYGKEELIKVPDGIAHFWSIRCLKNKIMMLLIFLDSMAHPPMLLQVLRERAICFLQLETLTSASRFY